MSRRPVVIDASVAICLLLGEPRQRAVAEALQHWSEDGRPRFVPQQFWLEVVNRLAREPGMSAEAMLGAIHRLDTFGLTTLEPDRAILLQVIDRVERFRLTAYDALYLAIAESLDAELATFDEALISAGGDRAAVLLDEHRLHERRAPYEHDVTWPRYTEASTFLAKLRADVLGDYEREWPSANPGPRR